MEKLRENVEQFIKQLREANEQWEENMVRAGYDPKEVRGWMFYVDEFFDEIQRGLHALLDVYEESDPQKVPDKLIQFVPTVGEIVVEELTQNMELLQELLEKYVPDVYKIPKEDEESNE